MTRVYLEIGKSRVFACALDWPGWCRSGRNEEQALANLEAYTPRYATAIQEAGIKSDRDWPGALEVIERVTGNATTDFGVPGIVPTADCESLKANEAARLADLMAAAWRVFDRTASAAPRELRKGPRGGGRDTEKIIAHVWGAEVDYARKLGLRLQPPAVGDRDAGAKFREQILAVVRGARDTAPVVEKGWLPRYAARRIAWHALDHAWEIEDRSDG